MRRSRSATGSKAWNRERDHQRKWILWHQQTGSQVHWFFTSGARPGFLNSAQGYERGFLGFRDPGHPADVHALVGSVAAQGEQALAGLPVPEQDSSIIGPAGKQARKRPSELKANDQTPLPCSGQILRQSPVDRSQSLIDPSWLPVATILPSGCMATARTRQCVPAGSGHTVHCRPPILSPVHRSLH